MTTSISFHAWKGAHLHKTILLRAHTCGRASGESTARSKRHDLPTKVRVICHTRQYDRHHGSCGCIRPQALVLQTPPEQSLCFRIQTMANVTVIAGAGAICSTTSSDAAHYVGSRGLQLTTSSSAPSRVGAGATQPQALLLRAPPEMAPCTQATARV